MKMQHKILFLVSLPEDIISKMESEGHSYSECIGKIKANDNVVLKESIAPEDLKESVNFDITIIVAHHVKDNDIDALILAGNKQLHVSELIASFAEGFECFDKIIDLACCNASDIAQKIKELCPNSKVMAARLETGAETRLHIYPILFDYIAQHPEVDYREAYLHVLQQEKDKQKNKEKTGELLVTTKLGTISTSAAPKKVYRNSPFQVKVYIHIDGNEADINAEINGYGYIPRKIRDLKLNNGDQILWELSFNTNPKPEYAKHILGADRKNIIWDSEKTKADYTFECFVEQKFEANGFNGVLKTTVGKNEIDKWTFPVTVLPYNDAANTNKKQIIGEEYKNQDKVNIYIRDVKVDSYKVNSVYGNKVENELVFYIDSQINKAKTIQSDITGRIRQDYINLKGEILKVINARNNIENVKTNEDLLFEQKERLYVLDSRHTMLRKLSTIYSDIKCLKLDNYPKDIREDITNQAYKFFDLIDDVFYNNFIKKIYTNEKGDSIPFFTFRKDEDSIELRREYNGLAIMLANMLNNPRERMGLDDLHKYLYYKKAESITEKKKEIPSIDVLFRNNKRDVHKNIIIYIDRLINDKDLKKELDSYLATKEGYSSVIAYYLREICKSKEK